MRIHEGHFNAENKRIAIVIGRFNEFISSKLLAGARDCVSRHNGNVDNINVYWVPGAFEIPIIAKKIAENNNYDGIICLGAIIRGDTPHFEYISAECTKGIAHVAMDAKMPVIYGVLTTDTIDQAIERAGTKAGNKGFDAAMACIEMIGLFENLNK